MLECIAHTNTVYLWILSAYEYLRM